MTKDGTFYIKKGSIQVVGLSGKARCGKDYLSNKVVEPLGFLPLALANHFKVSAGAKGIEGLPADMVDVQQLWEKNKDELHRNALQQEGTERGRNIFGPMIWCRHLELWMYYFATKGFTKFVVTDVRFPNEIEWIKSLGGKVYRITGRGGLVGGLLAHESELALDAYDGYDGIVDNSPENKKWVIEELESLLIRDFTLDAIAA